MTEQQLNEDCRRAVLRYLALRDGASFSAETITNGLRHDGGYDVSRVESALRFRAGLGHVRSEPDPVGSTTYWQVTSQGVLAHERGQ